MVKGSTIPLIISVLFFCVAFLLWLIPTQAQDDGVYAKVKVSDAEQAAAAMDAFAKMGSGIEDGDGLDVEPPRDSTKVILRPGLLNNNSDVRLPPKPATTHIAQATDVDSTTRNSTAGTLTNSSDAVRVLLVPTREVVLTSLAVDRVIGVSVDDGDRVKKGQVLVELSCDETRASLTVAKSRAAQYKMIHEANKELFAEDAITELDLELSAAKVDEGEGEVALAAAQMQRCVIKAPYDGTAVVVNVIDFANVQVGEPLLTIIDNSDFELILNVPSVWLRSRDKLIQKVFEVTFDETGKTYQAIVDRIGSVIDPSSRTVQLTAVIPGNNLDLVPGMSGNAQLSANDF